MKNQIYDEIFSILLIKSVSGIGPVRLKKIHDHYLSFDKFIKEFENSRNYITRNKILNDRLCDEIKKILDNDDKYYNFKDYAMSQINKANMMNGKLITYWDKDYPRKLLKTNQSIPLLFALGNTSLLNKKTCAVVGTRKPSNWTIESMKNVLYAFLDENYVISSGLAKGVDAVAHKTALEYGGNTISVLGCGLDVYYPKENKILQNDIKNNGLLLSEYEFGKKVTPLSLKKRNKIIVGLSEFLFIAETSTTGGTMNSYLAAKEQKKPVKIFLPISNVGGNFSGNLKIFKDSLLSVEKIKAKEFSVRKNLDKINTILFDLDGTLWNPYTAMKVSLINTLVKNNVKVRVKDIEKIRLSSESPISILKNYGINNYYSYWKEYEKNFDKINLYDDNAYKILKKLKNNNIKLGIVTHCKKSIAIKIMQKFKLNDFFPVLISPSETRARKPSAKPIFLALKKLSSLPQNTIYIGNEDNDLLSARNANCLSGHAAWNRHSEILVKPDFVFTRLQELLLISGDTNVLDI